MRAVSLLACLLLIASTATPSLAAKSKTANSQPHPTWARCYQISLDRGMDHEYEEWRQFIEDCVAGKIPLDSLPISAH